MAVSTLVVYASVVAGDHLPLPAGFLNSTPRAPLLAISVFHFVRKLAQWLAPNGRALAIVGVAMAVEGAFATTVPSHALWAGGWASVLAVVFSLWFWLTTVWAAWFLANAVRRADKPHRWILAVLATVVVLAGVVVYAVSWTLFVQTGRFANWEAVRFALTNLWMLADYVWAADVGQIVYLTVIVATFIFILPLVARWLTNRRWQNVSMDRLRVRQLATWLLLGTIVSGVKLAVAADNSVYRSVTRMDRVENCLNPALTLVTSGIASWRTEPIEPCLDTAELVPLASSTAADDISSVSPRLSVIIVAVESLRHDVLDLRHQGREVTPNINALARQSVRFTRAYAQSTHSDYADVCLPSSLYPLRTRHHHFYRKDDPWPRTLLHDVLKRHGYATAIISSQNEAWGGMDAFLETPGLDYLYHPETSHAMTLSSDRDPGFIRERRAGTLLAGKFPDGHTTDVAMDWIERQTKLDKPFCLAINFQSSHFPYLIPDDSPRPFRPYELDADVKFSSYSPEQAPTVRNAYLNGMAECDRQVGRLVAKLRELGQLDRTILVVTGENGEAFHESGAISHAAEPVEPVIHVAATIHAPLLLQPARVDYPFEHVDLAPTILGLLNIAAPANFQGIDVFSATRTPADERLIFVHVNSPIAKADAVLLGGRWKLVVGRDRPWGELYDVVNDPENARDLSDDRPELKQRMREALDTWRRRQLAYYHFPMYYQHYYPPRPPLWSDDRSLGHGADGLELASGGS